MLRLPRAQTSEPDRSRNGSPPGGSTFTTEAPLSNSSIPAIGPATPHERSRTRIPSSTPAMSAEPLRGPGVDEIRDVVPRPERVQEVMIGLDLLVGLVGRCDR